MLVQQSQVRISLIQRLISLKSATTLLSGMQGTFSRYGFQVLQCTIKLHDLNSFKFRTTYLFKFDPLPLTLPSNTMNLKHILINLSKAHITQIHTPFFSNLLSILFDIQFLMSEIPQCHISENKKFSLWDKQKKNDLE